jgi:DNA polymerase I
MEPLMDFLGYYLSEGHVRLCKGKRGGQSYIISITNIDPEVRAQVRKCIVDAFGIHPRRIRRDTIGINAKIIYLLLTKLMKIGQNAYTKQFPNFIFSLPNEYKWRLLRAYYRGDGTSEHRTAIKFTTVSKELANQLLFLLMQLQLTGLSIIQEGHFYRIYARDSNIPFGEITDRGLRYNYSLVIPKACLPNGGETIHLKRLKKSVKRDKLIATINELEQSFKGNSHLLGNLRDFAMGDLALDKVIEIRRVKPTKPYVYDLSIDGSENFVAGFGWIAAHNSYGVFGAEHFSLFCPPVAESTAAVGRFAITQTIQKAQSLKIPVLYGDTDSVFLENPSEEQIKNLLSWSEQNLGMELDVDKVYRYSVFSTRKKNYLGVFPDGSVDIKGLTGKKRNTPEFLKKAFSDMVNILSGVKSPEEFEKAREEIKEIVKTCYLKLKRREYTLNDLAFTIVLGKGVDEYRETTPQHVKAAKLLPEEKVQSLGRGDVIRFVKVTGREGVKPVELASLNEIDVDKYMEYVETTFEQVLDALGLDFREILGLTRLEYFMADFNEKP